MKELKGTARGKPEASEKLTIVDCWLLIFDWKMKNSPRGHFKNQKSTIVTHQSICV
jgi:hypothetical protein